MNDLMQQAIQGSTQALARLISLIENEGEGSQHVMKKLYSRTGRAEVIGVTGPPGVGKSTLIALLADRFARENKSVGILAVDPSSEISGGALLGDRVRMANLVEEDRIFIRSVSSRGCMGGVSRTTENIVRIMDAAGRDVIIIETIGVGQDECDVTRIVQTSILVLAPGLGDEIQFLKAGITEMADVFVVNKCDQPGAKRYFNILNQCAELSGANRNWDPPVVETDALHHKGIDALRNVISEHQAYLQCKEDVLERKNEGIRKEVTRRVEDAVLRRLAHFLQHECDIDPVIQNIVNGHEDPYTGVERIINQFYEQLQTKHRQGSTPDGDQQEP